MEIALHAFRFNMVATRPSISIHNSSYVRHGKFAVVTIPDSQASACVYSDDPDYLEALATAAMDAAKAMREMAPAIVIEPADEPGITMTEHDLGEPVA